MSSRDWLCVFGKLALVAVALAAFAASLPENKPLRPGVEYRQTWNGHEARSLDGVTWTYVDPHAVCAPCPIATEQPSPGVDL